MPSSTRGDRGKPWKSRAARSNPSKKTARFARLRFDNGYTSYIEVLDAERSLFNVELARAQTKGNLFQALVNLYKAMGGGWAAEKDAKAGNGEKG